MARRYARDNRGRFAGGGGGGGGSKGGKPKPPAWSPEMKAARGGSGRAKPRLVGRGRVKQPNRATYRGTDAEGMAVFGSAKKPKGRKIPANTPKTAVRSEAAKRQLEANALFRSQNKQYMNQAKNPFKWR
jgi:hypothetical protein